MTDCADKPSMSLGWQLPQTFFSVYIHITQKKGNVESLTQ